MLDFLYLLSPVIVIGMFLLLRDLRRGRIARAKRSAIISGNTAKASRAEPEFASSRTPKIEPQTMTQIREHAETMLQHEPSASNAAPVGPATGRKEPPLTSSGAKA